MGSCRPVILRVFLPVLLWVGAGVLAGACGQAAVDEAIWQWESGQTQRALSTISSAVEGREAQNPEAWYVLGFFEKERFKSDERWDPNSPRRESALAAFRRSMALQPQGVLLEDLEKALRFVGDTYFQQAMNGLRGLSPGQAAQAVQSFNTYLSIDELLGATAADLDKQRAEWDRQMGLAHGQMLSAGRLGATEEQEALVAAVGHYEASLALEPEHYSTLYNLAITLYNHGVRQLKRIGPETSMFELMEIQDVCIALFEESLPVMERAHAIQPRRLETLKGLMTIHHALSQPEASEKYRLQLEEVIRAGGGE